jgi:hypothetical protein
MLRLPHYICPLTGAHSLYTKLRKFEEKVNLVTENKIKVAFPKLKFWESLNSAGNPKKVMMQQSAGVWNSRIVPKSKGLLSKRLWV